MEDQRQAHEGFVPVSEIEVNAVRTEPSGFVLEGRGSDRADYRLEMHLDIPVNRQTQTILGEMLAQSEWRVWRRAPAPIRRATSRSPGKPVS